MLTVSESGPVSLSLHLPHANPPMPVSLGIAFTKGKSLKAVMTIVSGDLLPTFHILT